jgi:hypothetical protein
VNVAIPTHLDARQKELLTELGNSLGKEVVPQGNAPSWIAFAKPWGYRPWQAVP